MATATVEELTSTWPFAVGPEGFWRGGTSRNPSLQMETVPMADRSALPHPATEIASPEADLPTVCQRADGPSPRLDVTTKQCHFRGSATQK